MPLSLRRRRLVALGLLSAGALVTLGAVLLPYRPVIVSGAQPPPGPYPMPAAVAGLRLHVFNTGMNRMSALLVGEHRPWRPAPAFVIEHPREGLIVFDCGLSTSVAREGESALPVPMRWLFESRGREGRTLDAQMREAGLEPARARWVIISHLHDDHIGAAASFEGATFIGGLGTAGKVLGLSAPRWREVDFHDTRALPPFDASLDLFGDGSVVLLRGGGHAREDVMALLALPGGPVLLSGDAVVHREWLHSDNVERVAVDSQRAADVRNQVRALLVARPDVTLLPGHELQGAPGSRGDVTLHHPEWFKAEAWPLSH
ncbi:hypothetical protein MEBOL_005799 [Melittangium boletus DSM 14713]|uniref:Metallo-beta-lactamase domain-containing protein n=1 Tax=Melittangium boletus DSM 14713 TaxID=1294270 RepID=A0A250IM74_9BACT|nr:hypothetical protein MEBOL_005799 [Melittangium boletus DSM 14713]